MNNDQRGIPDNIRAKFPQLKPLSSPPSLMLINGFGVGIYGKRDFDQETQTYVKTRCICALFVPLFALAAYRVADAAPRRWYFIGREPLSGLARSWNMAMGVVMLFLAASIAWNAYTNSPDYQARMAIKHAAELLQAGKPIAAAGVYRQQIFGPQAADARAGFKTAIESCLQSDKALTAAAALHLVAGLAVNANQPEPLVPDAFNRGLALVERFRAAPADAMAVLDATTELDSKNAALPPLRIGLLKQVVAANPDDTNHVVELAVTYEQGGQMEESWNLLRPYKDRLGATEGARILGQKLLQEQKYADAYGLLFPFVQARLDTLRGIEVSYSNTVAGLYRRALADLNNDRAGRDFYEKYKAASKNEKGAMVEDYVQTRMESDPVYQRARADLKEANRIVPVTLDLGIVQLNRAQELPDAAARKTELEAAEKTFLAIRGFAGETDEYRLFLGQVYYWLGRSKEGRALFDELLISRKRDFSILMSISRCLRSVGEEAESRSLAEEGYRTATSDKQKYAAASFCALTCKDEDEQIAWLQKSDPNVPWIQIELNEARGKKALSQANKTLAADYLRKAVTGYESQPKSSAELNNWALACFDLYQATGNIEDQKKGMSLFEEAVAMDPGNSILLHNTTYFLFSQAVMDVNREAVNFAALGEQADVEMLPLLFQDEAGRADIYQRLHDSEAMKKGLGYLDKALLLAPKEIRSYVTALALDGHFRDLAALQKLQQRFEIAAPDLTENKREAIKNYAGAKDKENLEKLQKHIASLKEIAARCATNGDSTTLEYINVTLNHMQMGLWAYGEEIDGVALVDAALANYQKHQNAATHRALQSAYFFLANQQLANGNPDYAALVKQSRRSLAPQYLVTLILEHGGPLAELARKNENVAKGVGMEKENLVNFPAWAGISQWAVLRHMDPESAATAASRINGNQIIRLIDSLQYQFSPWEPPLVLEQYWTQRLLGDEKRAAEIYQAAVRDGVPLPAI